MPLRFLLIAILKAFRDVSPVQADELAGEFADQLIRALPPQHRERLTRPVHVTLGILCATLVALAAIVALPTEPNHPENSGQGPKPNQTAVVVGGKTRYIYPFAGASASTYYISPTGTDQLAPGGVIANTCNSSNPCASLGYVMQTVGPGVGVSSNCPAVANGINSAGGGTSHTFRERYCIAIPGDTITVKTGTYGIGVSPSGTIAVTDTCDYFNSYAFDGTGGSSGWTATVSGGAVTGITGGDTGNHGYTAANPPQVEFSGSWGTGAAATATVSGGGISGWTVTSGGSGYTTAPVVTVVDATQNIAGADSSALTTVQTDGGTVTVQLPANPSEALQEAPLLYANNCYNVDWKGLSLVGMNGRSDVNYGAPAGQAYEAVALAEFQIAGPDKSIIENFSISHAQGTCIKDNGSQGFTIRNNTLSDCGRPGNYYDHGMYLHASDLAVYGNTVTGSPGNCIQYYGGLNGPGTFYSNTLQNCGYAGLVLDHNYVTAAQNVITNSGVGVASDAGGLSNQLYQQNVIAGNTADQTVASCVLGSTGHGCTASGTPCPASLFWKVSGIAAVTDTTESTGSQQELWIASQGGPQNAIRRFIVNTTTNACTATDGADLTTNVGTVNALQAVTVNGTTEVWASNTSGTLARYLQDGTANGTITLPGTSPNPTGIAWDSTNHVAYVADYHNNTIYKYDDSGATPTRTTLSTNVNISSPMGMALVGSDLWVVNSNNTIARIKTSDGSLNGSLINIGTDEATLCGGAVGSPIITPSVTGGIAAFNSQVWIANGGSFSQAGFSVYSTAGAFVQADVQYEAAIGNGVQCVGAASVVETGPAGTQTYPHAPVVTVVGGQGTSNSTAQLTVIGSVLYNSVTYGGLSGQPMGMEFGATDGLQLYNNTLYGNGQYELYEGAAATTGPVIENNIFDGSGSYDYPWLRYDMGTGTVLDYNAYYNTASSGSINGTLASNSGAHSITTAPPFVSPPNNLHLASIYGPGRAQSGLTGFVGPPAGSVLNATPDMGAYQSTAATQLLLPTHGRGSYRH